MVYGPQGTLNMASSPGSFSEGSQSCGCRLHDISEFETDASSLLNSHNHEDNYPFGLESRGLSLPRGDAFYGGSASKSPGAPASHVGLQISFFFLQYVTS
jgi:hypothetical protein